jgi:hypothetical protein
MVVATIALVMAMSGAGYAATTDTQSDRTIAKNYFNNHIGSASVAHANTASTAGTSNNANNASALGGVPASGYTRTDCNAQTGAIKGWAAIPNAASTFSSTFVNVEGYNCSGGAVQGVRLGVGVYEVKFIGSPVTVMVGTVNGGTGMGFVDSHENAPGDFIIGTRAPGGALTDGIGFAIITP